MIFCFPLAALGIEPEASCMLVKPENILLYPGGQPPLKKKRLCMFLHSFNDGHLCSLHILATVNPTLSFSVVMCSWVIDNFMLHILKWLPEFCPAAFSCYILTTSESSSSSQGLHVFCSFQHLSRSDVCGFICISETANDGQNILIFTH